MDVGRRYDPDSEPLSAEEVRRSVAYARLQTMVSEHQARAKAIATHSTPWGRQAATIKYLISDLQTAYRRARKRGPLNAAWWLLACLLGGTLALLLGAMGPGWPLPDWAWLLTWAAAVMVALGIIRRERALSSPPGAD